MRKAILLLPLLMAVFFFSCQKETSQPATSNEMSNRINFMLDRQKPVNKPTQSDNIDLLKANLDYSRMRIENSGDNEKLIIVPIKEGLKTAKGIDPNAIPNLLIIQNSKGDFRKVNIVLFFPKSGQHYDKVPDNTFYEILNTGTPDCNENSNT